MKTLKKVTAPNGNKLKFAKFSYLGPDYLVVTDLDCQQERIYLLGTEGILSMDYYDTGEKTLIKSFKQIIEAWETGEVWF